MRVSVNLDENLVTEIDKRAKQFHVSRSSYIALCVSRQMQMDEMTENLPTVVDLFSRFKELDFSSFVSEKKYDEKK